MTARSTPHATLHPSASMYAHEAQNGQMLQREFLTHTTALGVSATVAYGLLGLVAPAQARTDKKQGGTLRMSMSTFTPQRSSHRRLERVCLFHPRMA